MKVLVVGAGSWGTALALYLNKRNHEVTLWARDESTARRIAESRLNEKYLKAIPIPSEIKIVSGNIAGDFDVALVAVPVQFISAALSRGFSARIVVSCSKGIEIATLRKPTEIIREFVRAESYCVLSGPSHAIEVANGKPTSVVVAGDKNGSEVVQKEFSSETLRIYVSEDRIGVELAGALKNVIAVAAGLCDGLELGDNAKAALVSRGIIEMARIGRIFGANPSTFFGLAGIGDLVTSCYSPLGRNLRAGRLLASGKSRDAILSSMGQVAEGLFTCKAVYEISRREKVETPICEEVYRIVYESKNPRDSIRDLMTRSMKSETDDFSRLFR